MRSETFGEFIRKKRIERGLTLRQVSNTVDIDQSTMSKIERNELMAPQRIIKPLSEKLGVEYRELQIKYLCEKIYYELKQEDYSIESLKIVKKRLEREKEGTSYEIERKQLIKRVRDYFRNKPIDKAWIFGSFARSQESYDSDIDIIVKFKQPNNLDLFDYVGLKIGLEEITGRQVDLVEEGYLLPNAKKKIEEEKVLIYERKAG
ncbi:MAG: XRE family transcriptional regulator [Lewinellaceae bacterium]|nr:XRE family transcriptional regulator [Phaeodactylibacter sp.]MCB9039794.1 XRE family transcriptional regulator [Lewinellaceae bacterium]